MRPVDTTMANVPLGQDGALASQAFSGCTAICDDSTAEDMSLMISWARRWCVGIVAKEGF